MRNIVFLILVIFGLFLTSCSNFVNYRVKTSDGMILNIERQEIPVFRVGDKIQLQEIQSRWMIEEHPIWFRDTLYYLEIDSNQGWIVHEKTAIIEEIIK